MQQRTYYPTVSQGWILLLVILGYNVGILAIVSLTTLLLIGNAPLNDLLYSSLELIGYILITGATIMFTKKQIQKEAGSNITVERPKLSMAVVLLTIMLTPFAIVLLDVVAIFLKTPEWFKNIMNDAIRLNFISFILIGIAPAILEEVLFRGIVLKGMLKNYSPAKAILWSAAFFGIFHLNPWQAVPAFIIGIFIGWIYYRTRSLLPGMLLHGLNNSLAFLAMVFYPEMDDTLFAYLGYETFLIVFSISAVLFIAGCLALNKLMPPPVKFIPEYVDTKPGESVVLEPISMANPPEQN